ncbi:MAG: hypothetical protein QXK94_10275 [Candidatus Jordarchaeales archaeon]
MHPAGRQGVKWRRGGLKKAITGGGVLHQPALVETGKAGDLFADTSSS